MSKFKDSEIRDMLAQAGHGLHPSSELLTSYAAGELSDPAKGNIERHLENCEECRKILEVIRSTITEPTDEEMADISVPHNMSEDLKVKMELVSKIRTKQSAIVSLIAHDLVPEDMQFAIDPMVIAMFSEPLGEPGEPSSSLKNAAFSSGEMNADDLKVAQAIQQAHGQYQQLLSRLGTASLEAVIDTVVRDQALALNEPQVSRLRQELLDLFK